MGGLASIPFGVSLAILIDFSKIPSGMIGF